MAIVALTLVMPAPSVAAATATYRRGVVLVGFRPGVPIATRVALEARAGVLWARSLGIVADSTQRGRALRRRLGTELKVGVPRGRELRAVRRLRRDRRWVRFAEPDYLLRASAADNVPNDPSFALQWGSLNTGQNANGITGAAGADDGAAAAWNVTTGSRAIVIGEVDTGVDYNHPDLGADIWSNPAGSAAARPARTATTSSPARVVRWTTTTSTAATARTSPGSWARWQQRRRRRGHELGDHDPAGQVARLECVGLDRSADQRARLGAQGRTGRRQCPGRQRLRAFVGTAPSQALSDEIDLLGANNILFVTAAGNTGQNNDTPQYTRYPCGYDRRQRSSRPPTSTISCRAGPTGPSTVDMAAPGDNIYSTLRNGSYGYISGGSMASADGVRSRGADPVRRSALDHGAEGGHPLERRSAPGSGRPRPHGRAARCVQGDSGLLGPAADDVRDDDRRRLVRTRSRPIGSGSTVLARRRGLVSKLSAYLAPTRTSGTANVEGVIYADAGGMPGALLGTTGQLAFSNKQSTGWYDLTFASPVALSAGTTGSGCSSAARATSRASVTRPWPAAATQQRHLLGGAEQPIRLASAATARRCRCTRPTPPAGAAGRRRRRSTRPRRRSPGSRARARR